MAYMTKPPISEDLLHTIRRLRDERDRAVSEAARITDDANSRMRPAVLEALRTASLRAVSEVSGVPVGTLRKWQDD